MTSLPWHIGLAVVAGLLLLNALFVAAEFALVTVRRTRIRNLADEGQPAARRTLTALGNLDYYVAASQLGITMASIALGFVGEPVLAHLIEPPVASLVGSFAPAVAHGVAIGVAFTFVTGLHIVIGEFVPKSIALQQPERTALTVSLPMLVFVRIFGPAIWLLNAIGNALLRMVGMTLRPLTDQPLAAEDLAYMLESSATAGLISRREFDLTRHALQLDTMMAGALMIPRGEIVAIPYSAERQEVLARMVDHRHTRYPVYQESIDDIVGIVDTKAVLLDQDATDWRRHIQPLEILPESASLTRALERGRETQSEIVVLIDEYGGTAGLLSFADVAGYLAGHLPDEYGAQIPPFVENSDGSITLSGLARLVDLESDIQLELPAEQVQTIGGYLLNRFGRIPAVGDEVEIDDGVLRVIAMDRYRIDQILLIRRSDAASNQNGEAMRDG